MGQKAKSQPGRAMSAMPLKAALRTLHRTRSHYLAKPPIPPAAAKPGNGNGPAQSAWANANGNKFSPDGFSDGRLGN